MRRASRRTTSSVASSAQCRSSSTTTLGERRPSSPASAATSTAGVAPASTTAPSSPPASCAMSANGPSGRGVYSASHAPHSNRIERLLLAERPHERRLADPGLAADEHEPPAPVRAHRAEVLVERRRAARSARAARRRGSCWSARGSPPHSRSPPRAVGLSVLPLLYPQGVSCTHAVRYPQGAARLGGGQARRLHAPSSPSSSPAPRSPAAASTSTRAGPRPPSPRWTRCAPARRWPRRPSAGSP